MIVQVTAQQVRALYEVVVKAGVLRDPGLLDGAVNAPFQVVFDRALYPSLAQKAGKLLDGIQRAQAYTDGKSGWPGTRRFCSWS
ncbi:hypothetical protein SAMN05421595_2481 [Austwickia chelonae]|uniref:Uncharacterized protein n=1 Tax=Austwickia chelonae NBRC 105200 TaxID=1184607 RepID=K6UNQ8_9MICO|nr:hypothetical protein [Austwickia chelonae]GAB79176.1 hypothetical protein AUCHE_21_00010 [Austwickia chelonae NBRC 105200]SEW36972.1 hypothetical protein SAMN05421595_2481 [Austwickia chelonae]